MNETTKRYLISSGVTFVSVFLLSLGGAVASVDVVSGLTASLVLSILGVALRAALKAATETLVSYFTKIQ